MDTFSLLKARDYTMVAAGALIGTTIGWSTFNVAEDILSEILPQPFQTNEQLESAYDRIVWGIDDSPTADSRDAVYISGPTHSYSLVFECQNKDRGTSVCRTLDNLVKISVNDKDTYMTLESFQIKNWQHCSAAYTSDPEQPDKSKCHYLDDALRAAAYDAYQSQIRSLDEAIQRSYEIETVYQDVNAEKK